ncbi:MULTISPECIES: alpha/beta hydrolase [Sphingobium]|uniref:Alpha/beta hydrolase n=1 Tax=Sphingobium tyrosinilyticum TaxID=2715436 RepID=A0ABV9EXM9_9SPHN|nr:alpha/beta hydrolase [Sphingobium sp. EP60837]ANI79453.1 Carboxylesterase NlhH [Sphingobium sp. EP60837]
MKDSIAAMGQTLGPAILDQVKALFGAEQSAFAERVRASATDLPYGPHERHRLDLYAPQGASNAPILIFFHGGGFLKGDKGDDQNWPNANVGRMAAQAGFVGIVPNYRLAPDHQWPAGPEDVAALIAWTKANAAQHGGDPTRIVLAGTSAGAVHVAGYIKRSGTADIRAAILLSGLYGYTPLDERDTLYYGDPSLYPERMPLEAIASTNLPLFIACAQHDPARFQQEFLALLQDRLTRHGVMPRAMIVSGHNHYSLPMHLGTADGRLADEICAFIQDTTN